MKMSFYVAVDEQGYFPCCQVDYGDGPQDWTSIERFKTQVEASCCGRDIIRQVRVGMEALGKKLWTDIGDVS